MSYTPGCRCEDCDHAHVWRFGQLSAQQQFALEQLFFVIPVHQSHLHHLTVRASTLKALRGKGLAELDYLYPPNGQVGEGMPFWNRTQRGDEMMAAVARHPDWFEE